MYGCVEKHDIEMFGVERENTVGVLFGGKKSRGGERA
jgi:hypothetical protein